MDLSSVLDPAILARLAIDLACVFALVRGVYFHAHRRSDLFLTFFAFNLAIFLIALVLNSTQISMGAAFGLFAVFSMLRYRTEGISTTDMTYLFLVIALGLVMSISAMPPAGLAVIGAFLVGFTLFLESGILSRRELRHEALYDNIALIGADARPALIADLKARTGLDVHRVEVLELDLVRDTARLAVFHHAGAGRAAKAAVALEALTEGAVEG